MQTPLAMYTAISPHQPQFSSGRLTKVVWTCSHLPLQLSKPCPQTPKVTQLLFNCIVFTMLCANHLIQYMYWNSKHISAPKVQIFTRTQIFLYRELGVYKIVKHSNHNHDDEDEITDTERNNMILPSILSEASSFRPERRKRSKRVKDPENTQARTHTHTHSFKPLSQRTWTPESVWILSAPSAFTQTLAYLAELKRVPK